MDAPGRNRDKEERASGLAVECAQILALTHDPKLDALDLMEALHSEAF
jgi:xanthine/CO dehydrogenase XdhC/CoxF family maturation factor